MAKQEIFIFKGTGPIDFGDYDPVNGLENSGFITRLKQISCTASKLTFKPNITTGTIEESCSGVWGPAFSYIEKQSFDVELELYGVTRDMLAVALNATTALSTAGTVTAELLPTVAEGEVVYLRNPLATNIVLTDSTGAPVTLIKDTHYTTASEPTNRIVFKNVTGLVQPFKAAYSFAAAGSMAPSQTLIKKSLVYAGKSNKTDAAGYNNHQLYIPKIAWTLGNALELMSQKPSSVQLKGSVELAFELINNPRFKGFYAMDGLPA